MIFGRPQDVQRKPAWWDDSELTEAWGESALATEPEDPTDYSLLDYLAPQAMAIADLVASKNADYGPHGINRAPGGALNGIHVRLHDKLERAINLAPAGAIGDPTRGGPNHESLRDTYVDVAGYALIALALLDGAWPE